MFREPDFNLQTAEKIKNEKNKVSQARRHFLQKKYLHHVLFHVKMNLTCQPIKFRENVWM